MNNKTFEPSLEEQLKNRRIPPCRPEFMQNIKAQALRTPQKISLWQEIYHAWLSTVNLKPAYALASALTLGVILGFGTASFQVASDSQAVQLDNISLYQKGYSL